MIGLGIDLSNYYTQFIIISYILIYGGVGIRIDLVKKFIAKFGKERIGCILGDREFIGQDWLGWLDSQGIDYVVRIKNNLMTTNTRGFSAKVSALFDDLAIHQHKDLRDKRDICNQSVYLSGTRSHTGELLIVASNSESIEKLIPVYGMRWEIENLFQAFKGREFNLEDTHLTDIYSFCLGS